MFSIEINTSTRGIFRRRIKNIDKRVIDCVGHTSGEDHYVDDTQWLKAAPSTWKGVKCACRRQEHRGQIKFIPGRMVVPQGDAGWDEFAGLIMSVVFRMQIPHRVEAAARRSGST